MDAHEDRPLNGAIDDEDINDSSKLDHGTPSSIGSSPDQDGDQEQGKDAPPIKRKGGRKPIYATSEERKQRNRQAQAAFRERRTEYIKQLEATIKQNEDALATLQQNHRSAADECLMLRYKNSLLERILLEKGIDVQAELQIKAGSPTFPASMMPMPGMQAARAPLQRTAVQRHHARRSANIMNSTFKMDGQSIMDVNIASPQAVPTPSSQTTSSPSSMSMRSPVTLQTGGLTPPATGTSHQPQYQNNRSQPQIPMHSPDTMNAPSRTLQPNPYIQNTQQRMPPQQHHSAASVTSNRSTSSANSAPQAQINLDTMPTTLPQQNASTFYPSPFQKHIDQLEQEYDQDATQSMLDQLEPDPNDRDQHLATAYQNHDQSTAYSTSHQNINTYGRNTYGYQQQLTPHSQNEQNHMSPTAQHLPTDMIDPNDPMLDADPFGLTASMHYPTSYSYGGRR